METNKRQCSLNNCPNPALHAETATTAHWLITISYCAEHHRELEKGTPLGPAGIDASRLQVEPLGVKDPVAPKAQPGLA